MQAMLQMWSDNKPAWWWDGVLLASDREGYVGEVELLPQHVRGEGGAYVLAIQNSNDYMRIENPQGTAYRLCSVWTYAEEPACRVELPFVLKE